MHKRDTDKYTYTQTTVQPDTGIQTQTGINSKTGIQTQAGRHSDTGQDKGNLYSPAFAQ